MVDGLDKGLHLVIVERGFLLGVGEEYVQSGPRVFLLHAVGVLQGPGEVGLEGFVHHVVHDGAWRVEGAGLLAGRGLRFLVVGGEQVFEHLAQEFRIQGDFLIDGSVLDDGELVRGEDVDQAPGPFPAPASFAGDLAHVHLAFTEEQAVGHLGTLLPIAGEAIHVDLPALVVEAVEALEQTAVEEGDVLEPFQRGIRIAEQGFVAIEVVHAVGVAVPEEAFVPGEDPVFLASGVHALVECGEKQVLEDGLVVAGFVLVQALQKLWELCFIEQRLGDEPLFLEEPAEDQPGEQADKAGGVVLFVPVGLLFRSESAGLGVVREAHFPQCPEIPVCQIPVEPLVQQFDVEDFLPGGVQGVEAGDGRLLQETGQGDFGQNIQVATVRAGQGDVADDGDLAQHVLFRIALVAAAVDDGDGEQVTVLDEHHDRHRKNTIELPGDGGQLAARVVPVFQFDGEEQVGLKQTGIDAVVLEQADLAGQLLVGELEENIRPGPVVEERLGLVDGDAGVVFSQQFEKCPGVRPGHFDGLVAGIPQRVQQANGRLAERLLLECLDGVLDRLPEVVVGHAVSRHRLHPLHS